MKEYIERDAALQDMWNALYALEDQREKHHGLDWFERKNLQDGFEAGQGVIANRPAADVVEVRHGRWIWLSSTYDRTPCEKRHWCDKCHHEVITHGSEPWEKYCPNCGAKMDGGAE